MVRLAVCAVAAGILVVEGCHADSTLGRSPRHEVRPAAIGDATCPGTVVRGDTLLALHPVQVPRVLLPAPGGWLLAGDAVTKSGDSEGWLSLIHDDGRPGWTRTIGGTGWQTIAAAVPAGDADDAGWVLAGTTDHGTGGQHDGWLVRVDRDGFVQWQASLGDSDDESIAALAPAGNGFLLAGRAQRAGRTATWLVRTDSIGQPLWQRTWDGPGMQEATALTPTSGNDVFLATVARDDADGPGRVALLRVDAQGKQIWQHMPAGGMDQRIQAMAVTGDGGLAATGWSQRSRDGLSDVWVIRLAADGRPLWTRIVGGPQHDQAHAIVADDDGGLTVAGATSTWSNGLSDAFTVRLQADGQVRAFRVYGGPRADHALALALARDGSVRLAGSVEVSAGNTAAWWVRTDAWGNPGCRADPACSDLTAAACDDDDPCTLDDCSAITGCSHSALTGGLACGTRCIGATCN